MTFSLLWWYCKTHHGTVFSLTVKSTQERMCSLLCICGNDLYFQQQTTFHRGKEVAQTTQQHAACKDLTWSPLEKTRDTPVHAFYFSLVRILLRKFGKLLDSCSKDCCLQFFIHVSRENFLEGHTATQAYTKINCLYRNLWVDVWVPGRTTAMYLRIHLELLTLNHSRAADFSVVVSVSKWALCWSTDTLITYQWCHCNY